MTEKILKILFVIIMESFRALVYFCLIWIGVVAYAIHIEAPLRKDEIEVISFNIKVPKEIAESKDCSKFHIWRNETLPQNNGILCPWNDLQK